MRRPPYLLLAAVLFVLALSLAPQGQTDIGFRPASSVTGATYNSAARFAFGTDYLGCSVSGSTPAESWCYVLVGTGASCQIGTLLGTNDFGVYACDTGTTTTGAGGFRGATDSWPLGGGAVTFESRVYVQDLSDGTDTFTASAGLIDSAVGGLGTDSVAFRYLHSENSGEWLCYTRSNSTESTADSNVAVVADTWYKLVISVNADASSAAFSINGSGVCTITTNIPTGIARATGIVPFQLLKSAGTNPRELVVDYTYVTANPTTAR